MNENVGTLGFLHMYGVLATPTPSGFQPRIGVRGKPSIAEMTNEFRSRRLRVFQFGSSSEGGSASGLSVLAPHCRVGSSIGTFTSAPLPGRYR